MVVGVARVALASLLLMALLPGAAAAEPVLELRTYDQACGSCGSADSEYCMDAWMQGVGEQPVFCINRDQFEAGGVDANPVFGPATYGVDPEALLTGRLDADLRTQRWTVVEDATTALPNPLDYDTFYLMRVERDASQDCVHLVDGAPGQGPEPFQSLCVRAGTTPSWPFGNITVYPRNAVLLVNNQNPASAYRVDVTVEFTYDCAQMDDTMVTMGDESEGTYRPFYLPYRPFVNEGLGGATDPLSTPAIVEVRVEDALGEVAVSRTLLPGAGQAMGYALFAQQELDGGSDLCA